MARYHSKQNLLRADGRAICLAADQADSSFLEGSVVNAGSISADQRLSILFRLEW